MDPDLSPVFPLTEARVQLFRIADEVLSGQVDRVRLTHRSQADDLLLMRASAVAQLERELIDLRSRVAPALRPLAGLGTLHVSDDELLADLTASRVSEAVAADRKRGEVAAGLRYPRQPRAVARVAEATALATKGAKAKRPAPKRRGS
jgi:hypothetical protein